MEAIKPIRNNSEIILINVFRNRPKYPKSKIVTNKAIQYNIPGNVKITNAKPAIMPIIANT